MKNRFAFVVSRCSLAHMLRQSVIENDEECKKDANCNAYNCIVFKPDISRFRKNFVQKLHLFDYFVNDLFTTTKA